MQTVPSNASNLAKHLKDRHPDVFKELKASEFQFVLSKVLSLLYLYPLALLCSLTSYIPYNVCVAQRPMRKALKRIISVTYYKLKEFHLFSFVSYVFIKCLF